MQRTRIIMGMPIQVTIPHETNEAPFEKVFDFFTEIDRRFSPYKDDSEVALLNRGKGDVSKEMQEILALSEKTKEESDGYFDSKRPDGTIDPSGITKGWAILKAQELLKKEGYEDFCIDVGGDITLSGLNEEGNPWSIGIQNPFQPNEIVKVIYPEGRGVATSGSYIRGDHIYDPHAPQKKLHDIVSVTVVGSTVLDADRFATAAFAMGRAGVRFLETLPGYEAYVIDRDGIATMTSGFAALTKN